jgi:hypothetical protein
VEPDEAAIVDQRDAVAYVCRNLEQFRVALAGSEAESAILSRFEEAVRSGQDLGDVLDALHRAVQANGDALGVFGPRSRSFGPVIPGESGGPWGILFLCPLGRCSGRRYPRMADFPLRCSVSGESLLRKRI